MHEQMMDGGEGSTSILVNVYEMLDIIERLNVIYTIYSTDVAKHITNLSNSDFYREGEALEVIERHKDILNKVMELADNYNQASLLVNHTLAEMIKKDEELQRILQVQG
ncbi:hypothetical protein [Priestia taiwanensis]|uniref:Uncharacterized protein n=1 Tax=Priestia taiwanensis TaxID=1347902 RepID=A0A917ALA1_9BACI|nr:hypothetical protein [Priestia taiwanensis]MBM7362094.1 DNA integrity scanning protein DisA with diadenylate cyclase activity [Priestia taiwanensis]GGE59399.1 hypothetical protein GCM10007140_07170 [Priestia taiwanensis]